MLTSSIAGQVSDRLDHAPALMRRVSAALVAGIAIGIVLSTLTLLNVIVDQWGEDYQYFVGVADHWRQTGQLFLDHQLAGPYVAVSGIDVLYPPIALVLFVPFLVLPAFVWWVVPLGIITTHVLLCRPAWWAWPVLALLLWVPRSQSIVIWGSTSMWVAAFVALGVRFAWPSLLIAFKPSFFPLLLIGCTRRAWWIGAAATLGVSVTFGGLWLDYYRALTNNSGDWPGLLYSLPDTFFVAIPLVAWLSRTRSRPVAGALALASAS